jgi:hypothetical protein
MSKNVIFVLIYRRCRPLYHIIIWDGPASPTMAWRLLSNQCVSRTSRFSFLWHCHLYECDDRWGFDWYSYLLHTYTAPYYTSQITIGQTRSSESVRIFTNRCLVATSIGRRFPYSGFPNCLRPQLPASQSNNSQQLNSSGPITHSPTLLSYLILLISTWSA